MRRGRSDLSLFFAPVRGMSISPTKGACMLGEFSIVPLGACTSVGSRVAEVLRLIDARDIVYKVTPMGTVVEGAGEDVLRLIKRHQITLL